MVSKSDEKVDYSNFKILPLNSLIDSFTYIRVCSQIGTIAPEQLHLKPIIDVHLTGWEKQIPQ
jgi:hypothetical protein